jgi:phage-related protein
VISGLAFYIQTGIMMADEQPARRPLFWGRKRKERLQTFPTAVQKDMGVALFVVQLGGTPPSAKSWKGQGGGVYELIEDHRGNTYRAVYTVRIADSVYVLHAF